MPNIVNTLIADELKSDLADCEGMLLVSYHGLTMVENEALRNSMAEKGVKFRMVRNSLARRVLAERGIEIDASVFTGNTAIAYGEAEHAIVAAKVLTDKEVRKAGKVKLRAGVLEGRVLGEADTNALSDVPDRDTLNAMLLGVISGPARSLVTVIDGTPSGLARVLQARIDAAGGDAAGGDEA